MYDPTTGTYTYVWKTDKEAWAGKCGTLIEDGDLLDIERSTVPVRVEGDHLAVEPLARYAVGLDAGLTVQPTAD